MKSGAAFVIVGALALGACAAPSSWDGITGGAKPLEVDAAIVAPRQISPISVSMVATKRPRLKWRLDGALTGAVVEMSRTREFLAEGTVSFEASGSELVVPEDLELGIWFWRLRGTAAGKAGTKPSPTWEVLVRGPGKKGSSDVPNGSVLDVDGDGLPDLLTVGDGFDPIDNNYGAFPTQYKGNADGTLKPFERTISSMPCAVISKSFRADDTISVGGGTDLDGDGFADGLSSSLGWATYEQDYQNPFPHADRLSGSPTGLNLDSSALIELPLDYDWQVVPHVAAAGDVDGDGYGDAAISVAYSAFLAKGSATSSFSNVPLFMLAGAPLLQRARSVLVGFDADGDGIGDVAVANPQTDFEMYLSRGVSWNARQAIDRNPTERGGEVQGAAPVIGSNDLSQAVFVTSGTPGGPLSQPLVLSATRPPSRGATAGAMTSGDFDGDGLADVAVAIEEAASTKICVYSGSRTALLTPMGCIAQLEGSLDDMPGLTTGDVDDDGQDELLVVRRTGVSVVRFGGDGTPEVESLPSSGPAKAITTLWPGRPGKARWAVGNGSNEITVYEGTTEIQRIAAPAMFVRGFGRVLR